MVIYRLVNEKYKEDISGTGSFLYGGRWNSKGLYALYAAEHISLAVLEIMVNYNRAASGIRPRFYLMELAVPDVLLLQVKSNLLKKDWQNDWDLSRFMGDQFLKSNSHLVLAVPSAVVPEENNYIINPLHKDFKKVEIKSSRLYGLDNRLF